MVFASLETYCINHNAPHIPTYDCISVLVKKGKKKNPKKFRKRFNKI